MISETSNQFACFARLLLFGGGLGFFEGAIKTPLLLLSKDKLFKVILYALFGGIAGTIFVFVILSFPYVKESLFYPIVFCVGIYMGEYIIDTIVALLRNLCYNKVNNYDLNGERSVFGKIRPKR